MLNFVWNTWKFWWNETDDEILPVFPDIGHFLVSKFPSHNVVKRNASGKKGQLLCCKRIFDRIKANLAEI